MAGDVVSSCSVIKELVTLAAGQYTGDSFEIGNFYSLFKPIVGHFNKTYFKIKMLKFLDELTNVCVQQGI